MCGIAGLIHRGGLSEIGREMTSMLHSLKHRGPDSTGFALFGAAQQEQLILRVKLAERQEVNGGQGKRQRNFRILDQLKERAQLVEARIKELGAKLHEQQQFTDYACRYSFTFQGDSEHLAHYLEDIEGVEILSMGKRLELIKDLGDAVTVAKRYGIESFRGSHAIGHTRMATESAVDIRSAHPYWAFPFSDIAVVHNGQLTNYWKSRRDMERRGHRFTSNCDSELIAVYVADRLDQGESLEAAMHRSIEELDGVFTYLVATEGQLGMAKDVMAAKPMVLYESDECVALASEEIAIRSIFPKEIDTWDPYEGEVMVWQT